jgi:phage repressor protein C with HTH and peptisase S24 domain
MNKIRDIRLAKGWSMQKLAEAAGTTRAQIDKLEKGERRLTVDWLVRLAKPLGTDPRELMGAMGPVATHHPKNLLPVRAAAPDLLAVRSAARGGDDQEMFLADGPIDHVPRPYYLAHAAEAYAIYVIGLSMVPMYKPGQLLFVNPFKPPITGAGVIITKKNQAVLVKEFVRIKGEHVTVREYQPHYREFLIPLADIISTHVVVGTAEG